MSSKIITDDVVTKVAQACPNDIPPKKSVFFSSQLEPILEHFDSLNKIDVNGVGPTYQVTGQKNRLREDIIDTKRMFTQQQALANAPKSKDGYFVYRCHYQKMTLLWQIDIQLAEGLRKKEFTTVDLVNECYDNIEKI